MTEVIGGEAYCSGNTKPCNASILCGLSQLCVKVLSRYRPRCPSVDAGCCSKHLQGWTRPVHMQPRCAFASENRLRSGRMRGESDSGEGPGPAGACPCCLSVVGLCEDVARQAILNRCGRGRTGGHRRCEPPVTPLASVGDGASAAAAPQGPDREIFRSGFCAARVRSADSAPPNARLQSSTAWSSSIVHQLDVMSSRTDNNFFVVASARVIKVRRFAGGLDHLVSPSDSPGIRPRGQLRHHEKVI